MLWKFPNDPHLIALNLVQLVTPIRTTVTPAEDNFEETRKCSFTVTVAGHVVEIAVVDYNDAGMLGAEDWNTLLDQLEADYEALVWELTGASQKTPPATPEDDVFTGGLKAEVFCVDATTVRRWNSEGITPDGTIRISVDFELPVDGQHTDEVLRTLESYANHARMPQIHMDEPPLGSAAL
jgi:hypothetical protein